VCVCVCVCVCKSDRELTLWYCVISSDTDALARPSHNGPVERGSDGGKGIEYQEKGLI
jgi:hypothetical protein